jgi:hypothetical protein
LFIGTVYAGHLLYLNNGQGTFTDVSAARLPTTACAPGVPALGDVDGDGDLDVAIALLGGAHCLWSNDGSGRFADASTRLPRGVAHEFRFADVDLDGDLDLLGHAYDAAWSMYVNDGQGRFTDATASGGLPVAPAYPGDVAVADFDDDGDPDIVVGTTSSLPNRLLVNLRQQLHVADPARVGGALRIDAYAFPVPAQPAQLALPWIAARTLPTPFHFAGLGRYWLDPATAFLLGAINIPPTAGSSTLVFPVPNDPQLAGVAYHLQAAFLHSPNPADWRFSNLVSQTVR